MPCNRTSPISRCLSLIFHPFNLYTILKHSWIPFVAMMEYGMKAKIFWLGFYIDDENGLIVSKVSSPSFTKKIYQFRGTFDFIP